MKKLVEIIVAVKYTAGMAFTGMIAMYLVFSDWLMGEVAIPHTIVWQALFLALLLGVQQFVCFTDYVLKNASNKKRLVLFSIKFYITISIFAVLFHWFPLTPANWLLFTGIFLAVFVIVAAVFSIYFKITGNKYNQMLDAYRSR